MLGIQHFKPSEVIGQEIVEFAQSYSAYPPAIPGYSQHTWDIAPNQRTCDLLIRMQNGIWIQLDPFLGRAQLLSPRSDAIANRKCLVELIDETGRSVAPPIGEIIRDVVYFDDFPLSLSAAIVLTNHRLLAIGLDARFDCAALCFSFRNAGCANPHAQVRRYWPNFWASPTPDYYYPSGGLPRSTCGHADAICTRVLAQRIERPGDLVGQRIAELAEVPWYSEIDDLPFQEEFCDLLVRLDRGDWVLLSPSSGIELPLRPDRAALANRRPIRNLVDSEAEPVAMPIGSIIEDVVTVDCGVTFCAALTLSGRRLLSIGSHMRPILLEVDRVLAEYPELFIERIAANDWI